MQDKCEYQFPSTYNNQPGNIMKKSHLKWPEELTVSQEKV